MMKKEKVIAGTLFALPLNEQFGVGLIAAVNGPIALSYFFKKTFDQIPPCSQVKVDRSEIAWIKIISTMGITKGYWRIIGYDASFDSNEWPIPFFRNKSAINDQWYKVSYNSQLEEIKREVVSNISEIQHLPDDGIAGTTFVEKKLLNLLISDKGN